ncbi:MAG: hypothetical protein ACXWW9_04415 [Actinomycetota bacterium]
MTDPIPFCERCGRPGPSLSGMHVGDEGIVRWTLYRCGHVHTQIVLDDAAATTVSTGGPGVPIAKTNAAT